MPAFNGFPEKMEYTGVPKLFISEVLPQIDDLAELKVTLYILRLLHEKQGKLRFVSYGELAENRSLISGLSPQASACGGSPIDIMKGGLETSVARGTFLRLLAKTDSKSEDIFVLNTPKNRLILGFLQEHKKRLVVTLNDKPARIVLPFEATSKLDIMTLYEKAIGPVGSDLIADQLREAEKLYPQEWLEEAFKEAVSLNKRNWRYIEAILKRWMEEGKENGESERRPKTAREREEYFRQQYERSRGIR